MEDANATYVFRVHHYDSHADVTKEFLLFYYVETDTIELYDPESRRLFLKKCKAPASLQRQLYVNNTIQLVSRQLRIIDYGDERTRRLLASKRISRAGVIVKPQAYKHVGEILQCFLDADLTLSYIHMSCTRRCATATLPHETESCDRGTRASQEGNEPSAPTSAPLIKIEVVGPEAKERVTAVCGPSDLAIAKQEAPDTLRSLYGVSKVENAIAIVESDGDWSAIRDEASPRNTDTCGAETYSLRNPGGASDCSCCIIKPSGMKKAGCIISDIIEAGFRISAMQSFHLTKNAANEFYEVYQHVLKEQPLVIRQKLRRLSDASCVM